MTVSHVAVVGAGRMGQGIAAALAFGRISVTLVDLRDRGGRSGEYLDRVANEIRMSLLTKVDLGLLAPEHVSEVCDRVTTTTSEAGRRSLATADLVFEAVPEVIDAKRDALAWIESAVAADVPIASTTSSFLVDDLAGHATHPDRFLNAHWLNPADMMPLVELSAGRHTTERSVDITRIMLSEIGKAPVVCASSPGYIVPRLQSLVMNEAARMVAEGVATADDIDHAVRIGFGARFAVLGLLEFIDWGGCDTLFHASHYLRRELGERFAPAELVEEHMRSNRRGISDGQGFYAFDAETTDQYRARRAGEFAKVLDAVGQLRRYENPAPVRPYFSTTA